MTLRLAFLLVHSALSVYSATTRFTETVDSIILIENQLKQNDSIYSLNDQITTQYERNNSELFCYINSFSYDGSSNTIRLVKGLDREEMCSNDDLSCTITVKILIRTGGDFHRLFSLKVKVIDENDSAPDFRNQIFENMNLNFCRASLVRGINGDLFEAKDKDEKQKLSVTMKGDISEFVTLYKTQEGSENKLTIGLVPNASYESNQIYPGKIKITDGTFDTVKYIRLSVDDMCNQEISFTQKIYKSVIEENSRSLRTDIILQVNGEFNLLAYSEYVILDQSMREFISINDNTGEVMLRKTIDYEKTQVLQTIIAIKDTERNVIYDMTKIMIQVKDINDNRPTINTMILPPASRDPDTGNIMIREDTPKDVAIAYIDTVDADMTSAGMVDISMNELFDKKYFSFRSGFIILIKPLDRELIDFLQLGIHTCDQGQPISCAETMLRFDITDANDNNPYFTRCPRDPIRLPEDTSVGNKLIMVVRAKDNDRINGDNPSPYGEIRYQIQGDTFSIDSTTGRIFLNKPIDREVQDSHVIRVTASDGGGRTAVCEMKVQVQDVNDSQPQFNNFKNQIQVSTNVKQGEIIYEFDVTDSDIEDSIRLSIDSTGPFRLEDRRLIATSDFFAIEGQNYKMNIEAQDSAGHKSPITFEVNVLTPSQLAAASSASKTFTPVVIGGIITAIFLIFIILLIIILSMKYRKEKHQSEQAEFLHSKIYNDKFVEVPVVQSNGQFGDNGLTVTTPNGLNKEKSPILRVLRNMVKSSDSRDTANSEHVTTDSGKGESEHESLSSHHQVTNNNYSIQQTIQESRFGPNCVSECSMNGHSDQCWLIEFPRHFPRTQRSLDYHRSQEYSNQDSPSRRDNSLTAEQRRRLLAESNSKTVPSDTCNMRIENSRDYILPDHEMTHHSSRDYGYQSHDAVDDPMSQYHIPQNQVRYVAVDFREAHKHEHYC